MDSKRLPRGYVNWREPEELLFFAEYILYEMEHLPEKKKGIQ